ncbi:exodeoxyribonuclease V subunit gamma [Mycobacterium sp. 1274756.6]|uniref:exodeoxyribonuclease V subunit gamma n=1 Tax=Mycobacterium sp. 1274756.6 TaxID=1834076 RepID=UPI0007FC834E|nr:exodeoxyribonuclease V subunit gamma [Mycobacterium sp. 1274756.6]OBJ70960.1 exodeoxyribonuclease V subunit gamma [Mycobacterium sp. 1274756.6]
MPLHLHRAEDTGLLADRLGALLAVPPADPFAADLVLVPARGVERWLSQRLSHRLGAVDGDGVCAAVAFRSPGSLIAEIAGTDSDDPWSPEALVWPLLEVIDACSGQPWCRALAAHLGYSDDSDGDDALRRGRRYAVARRLAGLFSSYARQRPDLLADWSAGTDSDGAGGALDDDLAWQPPLWRELAGAVGAPAPQQRHAETLARLRAARTATLPERLSLFGHTRLSRTDLELLGALGAHHDLHLWLPHPSDALWQALRGVDGAVPRDEDTSASRVAHPLLATFARDLRELQRALPEPDTDEYLAAPTGPGTLLGWLQDDLAADAVRPAGRVPAAGDRSVQVHACHGAARQVDVLREVLLGLLADDETLQPRDIVVMCPDIEVYAPLIAAGFGLGELTGEHHPAHTLRVQLADRALHQTNPLLGVAAQLLGPAGSRVTATELLNLAQTDPVRARFAFTDEDLDVIAEWVRDTNIRWGFDAAHRAPYGLAGIVHNTWRFGLDRILTGVAMSQDAQTWLGTALPLDDVGSNRVELAGRLAEFVDRVQRILDELTGARPLTGWLTTLADGVAALTRVAPDDGWQQSQLQREFADVAAGAGERADTALLLPDVRALLDHCLAGRPTRANFRTGSLTVCTMVPMRSVPHRVVCLVGLDDGVFPRQTLADGDDVLARRPLTGERDPRSEDRQLLLDAICAARETLVITYTGADARSGAKQPPSVPLAELLDTLDATTEQPVRDRVVVRHPLQPFAVANVTPGCLGTTDRPFTFDPTALTAAEAAVGHRSAPPALFGSLLPAPEPADVELADLLAFFADPVRGFFRALQYTLPWEVKGVEDAMPVEIDHLAKWGVGDRMLRDMLAGMHPDEAANAEWRRGCLPPGRLGMRTACEIRDLARALAETALAHHVGEPDAVDVDVDLGGGRRLTGTVSPMYANRSVAVHYSQLGPKHALASWITVQALAAHRRGPWSALCIGRARNRVVQRTFLPADDPTAALARLVALYDAGRREPLPLPLKTSYKWATASREGGEPREGARREWQGSKKIPGENDTPAHVAVWGKESPLSRLLDDRPRPGEETPGEPTRFGALALRLWTPVLDSEELP